MATFPKSEGDIEVLAQSLSSGLAADAATFPDPPVLPANLNTMLTALNAAQHAADEARGIAESATAAKLEALEILVTAMKKDLRYAEYTCDYDNAILRQLGWGARKDPTPMPPPGAPSNLAAYPQDIDSALLSWDAPLDGGTVATYKVQRRKRPDGLWEDVGAAMEKSISLLNQPRGVELEYRIIASNKAGDSLPSNTVMVVL